MATDYFVGCTGRIALAFGVALPALVLVMALFIERPWWGVAISVAAASVCVVNSYFLYAAISRPLVSLSPTSVEVRSSWQRVARRIARRDIEAIAWSNSKTVALRLRTGELYPVDLRGLGGAARDAVQAELRSSLRVASNITQ